MVHKLGDILILNHGTQVWRFFHFETWYTSLGDNFDALPPTLARRVLVMQCHSDSLVDDALLVKAHGN